MYWKISQNSATVEKPAMGLSFSLKDSVLSVRSILAWSSNTHKVYLDFNLPSAIIQDN